MGIKTCLQILLIVSAVFAKSIPSNVTEKPTNRSVPNEGRSSGMSLYSQSSNAKVVGGQNLRAKVTYYTPKPSRVGQVQNERLPAKGEVQERFNPRPYFDYVSVHSNGGEESSKDHSKPAVVYGAPFDSFPVFNGGSDNKPSEVDAKPSDFGPPTAPDTSADSPPSDSGPPKNPSGLYDSPYDSYNPPKDDFAKPQASPVYPPADPKPQAAPPPPQPAKPDDSKGYPGYPYAPVELDHPPKDSYMPMGPGKDVILDYNPKEVDSYMPMEQAKPEMEDTGPPPKPSNYHDYSGYSDVGPRIVATVKPPGAVVGSYQDYPPDNYHYNHDVKHEQVVDTPPAPSPVSYGKIPDYVDHDPKEHGYHYPEFAHIEHPVYHEITTTTTEEPEERVNKGHYSYYYLGRKLWYIPLYFSAYFIIYITILILKSIARHKVNFIHDLHDLGKGRSARNMKIDELTANVTSAIETVQNKYMM